MHSALSVIDDKDDCTTSRIRERVNNEKSQVIRFACLNKWKRRLCCTHVNIPRFPFLSCGLSCLSSWPLNSKFSPKECSKDETIVPQNYVGRYNMSISYVVVATYCWWRIRIDKLIICGCQQPPASSMTIMDHGWAGGEKDIIIHTVSSSSPRCLPSSQYF